LIQTRHAFGATKHTRRSRESLNESTSTGEDRETTQLLRRLAAQIFFMIIFAKMLLDFLGVWATGYLKSLLWIPLGTPIPHIPQDQWPELLLLIALIGYNLTRVGISCVKVSLELLDKLLFVQAIKTWWRKTAARGVQE